MCLFPFPNKSSIYAKIKGITEFECGACPECLQKKSRLWALRCSMEAKVTPGVMVTLTYDTYKVIYGKPTNEENPTNPDIPLSKRDCQLFIKRLRKHFTGIKIKYLLTAERGKRTNRAHYHALLFGVQFNDLVKYKKSDRGNWIYKSKTLEKIWKNGICTVDCINLSAKTARYCTKYCAKDSGVDDTFMLFSRGIGEEMLLKQFDGRSYIVDGREYSIPKQIWQKVIEARYNICGYARYVPRVRLEDTEKKIYNAIKRAEKSNKCCKSIINNYLLALEKSEIYHDYGKELNEMYQNFRDNDPQYQAYLDYWHKKAQQYEFSRPAVDSRILALPDSKYRAYKTKAILARNRQVKKKEFTPPRSQIQAFLRFPVRKKYEEKSFAPLTRHYRANDTVKEEYREEFAILRTMRRRILLSPPQKIDTVLEKDVYQWSFTHS